MEEKQSKYCLSINFFWNSTFVISLIIAASIVKIAKKFTDLYDVQENRQTFFIAK